MFMFHNWDIARIVLTPIVLYCTTAFFLRYRRFGHKTALLCPISVVVRFVSIVGIIAFLPRRQWFSELTITNSRGAAPTKIGDFSPDIHPKANASRLFGMDAAKNVWLRSSDVFATKMGA